MEVEAGETVKEDVREDGCSLKNSGLREFLEAARIVRIEPCMRTNSTEPCLCIKPRLRHELCAAPILARSMGAKSKRVRGVLQSIPNDEGPSAPRSWILM